MNSVILRQLNINMNATNPIPNPKTVKIDVFTSKSKTFTTTREYIEDEPNKTKIKTTTVWFDKKVQQNKRRVSFEIYEH